MKKLISLYVLFILIFLTSCTNKQAINGTVDHTKELIDAPMEVIIEKSQIMIAPQ